MSAWEIAILADSGRISLDRTPDAWMDRFLARPGVEAVPLGWRAAARAYALQHLQHRDPGDRLLIATAIDLGCELVTYDARITAFATDQGRQYGLRVRS